MKPLIVVAGLAFALAACNNDPKGAVAGDYRFAGGPAPGLDRPLPGTIWAYPGHVGVSALDTAEPAGHVDTDAAGHFVLALSPGNYTLMGAQGVRHTEPESGCGTPMYVRVQASHRTTIHLLCDVA
jgi:hypothetical protein